MGFQFFADYQRAIKGKRKPTVGAAIINGDSTEGNMSVLLLGRQKAFGWAYELPSGPIREGLGKMDGLVGAVSEKVLAETALRVDVTSYIGAFDYSAGNGQKRTQLNFLTRIVGGFVKTRKKPEYAEGRPYVWVPVSWAFMEPMPRDSPLISQQTREMIKKAALESGYSLK